MNIVTARALRIGLTPAIKEVVAETERTVIIAAGERCHWNLSAMARLLKVTWRTVHDKMHTYKIRRPRKRARRPT